MGNLEIIMPVIILVVSFLLKLLIDRSITLNDLIVSGLELPVDILFVALSLIVGFTLAPNNDVKEGLLWFSSYIAIGVFIVFLWRRSTALYTQQKNYYIFALLNYIFSLSAIVISINLITGPTS